MEEWKDGRMEGWKDERIERRKNGRMGGCICCVGNEWTFT